MADQNSPDLLTPILPPIPSISQTPQATTASQTSSLDNDMPISGVVAALTEVKKPETTPTTPASTTSKSPLFEDPDQVKVSGSS